MKTIEQQKSELLDSIVSDLKTINMVALSLDDAVLIDKYDRIISPQPESTNPYIDEVFDMRICNVISDIMYKPIKKIRLSDCPHISKLDKRKNIGFGSIQAYESTMQKYGLNEKLI